MAATNKHKAAITLGMVSLGFFVSFPFSHSFLGGLMASGCSAAMVGGIADWFAVTALFRKPLGIPFRTEIIPRNRDRISQAIIDMVEQELLTKENIRETLNRYNAAALLVSYLTEYGGKEHVKEFLWRIGDDLLDKVNPHHLSRFLAKVIRDNASQIRLAPLTAQVLTWSLEQGYFDKLVDFLIGELRLLVLDPQVKSLLVPLIIEARLIYEGDMQHRRLASGFIEGLGVTPDRLAGLAQRRLSDYLEALRAPEHSLRAFLRQKAAMAAIRLAEDQDLQERFESWKDEFIVKRIDLEERLADFARLLLAAAKAETGRSMIHRWIGSQVERIVSIFKQKPEQQEYVGDVLKHALISLIDTHHAYIGTIVRERLHQLSTTALVEFIETRVGNDLQMIRINGSVVGGLVGMVIYLLTYGW